MRKGVIAIFLIALFAPALGLSQPLTNQERRKINASVLNAIELYEMCATNHDANAQYQFLSLFNDSDIRIYCDLMDYSSTDDKIELEDYVQRLAQTRLTNIRISEVKKGPPILKSDGWHIEVSLRKTIDYIDRNSIWFSANEYYGSDYRLVFDFCYDEQQDCCKIVGIEGAIDTGVPHLANHFCVIKRTSEKDQKLYLGKKPIQFNNFGQAFASSQNSGRIRKDSLTIRSWNDNVRLKYDTIAREENYDYVSLDYKRTVWRVKLRYAHTLNGIYKYPSEGFNKIINKTNNNIQNTDGNIKKSSEAYEYGVDFGLTFTAGRSSQIGLYVGAALQKSSLTLETVNPVHYSYPYEIRKPNSDFNEGAKNEQFDRKYTFSAKEKVNYTDLVVPIYWGFDHRLAPGFYLTWNLGAKFYFNQKSKDYYRISGSVISNEKTEESITEIDRGYTTFISPVAYSLNNDFSLIGGIGFNVNLFKNHILVSAKVGYEYGLGEVHSTNNHDYCNQDTSFYPLFYSSELNEDVATYSFMDCVSFRREALWLELGLLFKF